MSMYVYVHVYIQYIRISVLFAHISNCRQLFRPLGTRQHSVTDSDSTEGIYKHLNQIYMYIYIYILYKIIAILCML